MCVGVGGGGGGGGGENALHCAINKPVIPLFGLNFEYNNNK